MKRSAFLTALLVLLLAGCGGHHAARKPPAQHRYTVTISGHRYQSAHPPGFGLPSKRLALPRPQTGVATLEMFDTVTLGTVPSNPAAVAGYTSGSWPTFWPLVNAFPRAFHVPIAVYNGGPLTSAGTGRIMCLDIEPGDAGPGDAGPWARYVRTHGMRPCEYSSLSEMSSVRANLASWGELNTTILWDADWTYSPHVDSGFACTQWTDRSRNSNLDESTCLAGVFGPAPPPPPPSDPYAYLSKTVYGLGHGIKASEYNVVKGWNDRHCLNPTRRPVCGYLHYRLLRLRGRLAAVARRSHPPDYAFDSRRKRMAEFGYQLAQTKPPWKTAPY